MDKVYVLTYSVEEETPASDWAYSANGFAVNGKTKTIKVPSDFTTIAELNTEFSGTTAASYYTTVDGIQKLVTVTDTNATIASILGQVNASVIFTNAFGAWTVTK